MSWATFSLEIVAHVWREPGNEASAFGCGFVSCQGLGSLGVWLHKGFDQLNWAGLFFPLWEAVTLVSLSFESAVSDFSLGWCLLPRKPMLLESQICTREKRIS